MSDRKAKVVRTTESAEVRVTLNLDGGGSGAVQTGIPFLDRMLCLFARHGAFDLEIQCRHMAAGPEDVAEQVATCLGLAVNQALGDKIGIVRLAHAYAPVEENLARAVVDISGHPFLEYRLHASVPRADATEAIMVERFWRDFVAESHITLHIELIHGIHGLPAFEAVFKAAARALREACKISDE